LGFVRYGICKKISAAKRLRRIIRRSAPANRWYRCTFKLLNARTFTKSGGAEKKWQEKKER